MLMRFIAASSIFIISNSFLEILGSIIENNIVSRSLDFLYDRFLSYKYCDWSLLLKGDLYSSVLRRSKAIAKIFRAVIFESIDNFVYIYLVLCYLKADINLYKAIVLMCLHCLVIAIISICRTFVSRKVNCSFDATENKLKDIFLNYEMVHTYDRIEEELRDYDKILQVHVFWYQMFFIMNNFVDFSKNFLQDLVILQIYKIYSSSADFNKDNLSFYMERYTSVMKRNLVLTGSLKTVLESIETTRVSNFDDLKIENVRPGIKKAGFDDEIAIENLTKAYDDCLIFKDINLTIKKGEKIAITGQNGSGKTKFSKILANIEAYGARVSIDGVDLQDIENYSLRKMISFVSQEFYLFEATILENITCFDKSIDEEDVIKMVAKYGMESEFKMLGYDKMLIENGNNISMAQKQKICFLRAVLRNTPINVFDEITSNLDKNQEHILLNNIFNHLSDKTVLVIIHNLYLLSRSRL